MRVLVISLFLYACESLTLTFSFLLLDKRMLAFEMRCCQRLLNILYKAHFSDEEVRRKIQTAILSRIAQATASLTKLKTVWRDINIRGMFKKNCLFPLARYPCGTG